MKPLYCLKMCVKIDLRVIWTSLFLLGLPSIAQAHTVAENFNALNSFVHGFNHPFSGIDHLVGLLILGIGVGMMIDIKYLWWRINAASNTVYPGTSGIY